MAQVKWRSAFVEQARRLAALGLTDEEMARFFAIDPRTLYKWRLRHADFAAALRIGKDVADARVEQALYSRAIGYAHEAVKIHTIAGEVVQTPYVERYPPDVSAAMFWLKNRQPERWRERSEVSLVADLAQRIAAGRARLVGDGAMDTNAPSPLEGTHQSNTLMGPARRQGRRDMLLSPPFQGGSGKAAAGVECPRHSTDRAGGTIAPTAALPLGGCERSEPATPAKGNSPAPASHLGSTCPHPGPLPGGEREKGGGEI